jgi:hypothetical protein
MSEKRYVIHPDNMPVRWPWLGAAALWFLVLDRFNAPGWLWGAVGLLWVLITVGWIVTVSRTEYLPKRGGS